MHHDDKPDFELPQDVVARQPRGPVELDPAVFGLVRGGAAPRSGWQCVVTPDGVTTDPTAPRSGW